jgi:hypothetical protein
VCTCLFYHGYIGDKANEQQKDAFTKIFSGQARYCCSMDKGYKTFQNVTYNSMAYARCTYNSIDLNRTIMNNFGSKSIKNY